MSRLTVVCFLWDGEPAAKNTRYSHRHVNALRAMVAEHLSEPHDLVCLTDRTDGLGRSFHPDVRVVQCLETLDWPKRYRKLLMFSPLARQLIGLRFLYLDLDCVVTDRLDPLVDRDDDFVIWRDPGRNGGYNTSMILMDAGARPEVWATFDPETSPHECRRLTGTDQAWVTRTLGKGTEAMWTEHDGVMSYKRHCESRLPEHSRIVFFHGRPKPDEVQGWPRQVWERYAA